MLHYRNGCKCVCNAALKEALLGETGCGKEADQFHDVQIGHCKKV